MPGKLRRGGVQWPENTPHRGLRIPYRYGSPLLPLVYHTFCLAAVHYLLPLFYYLRLVRLYHTTVCSLPYVYPVRSDSTLRSCRSTAASAPYGSIRLPFCSYVTCVYSVSRVLTTFVPSFYYQLQSVTFLVLTAALVWLPLYTMRCSPFVHRTV